jgi:hypothetical protein
MLYLLPTLCLGSCSNFQPYGVYEFRLGKTDGAHFGVSAELKNEENEAHKQDGAKNMRLALDLGSEYSIEAIAEQYAEEYPMFEGLINDILKLIPQDHAVDGYYIMTDIKNPNYGTRVRIGSDYIYDTIKELYPDIEDIENISSLTGPEFVEMVVAAYVNEKQFTLQIPVSKDDLIQQLAWYGHYLDFNSHQLLTELDPAKLPGPKGEDRIGVHPGVTKDDKGNIIETDADKMNKTFEFEFSKTYLYQEKDGIELPVGSFVVRQNENGKKRLYFSSFDEEMSPFNITGKVAVKGLLSDEYVNIEFDTAEGSDGDAVAVDYNDKAGKEEGFTDKKGTLFTFNTFMKEPFEFRDFHDVKVGLAKI